MSKNLRTWIEIDRKAIRHNVARLKSFLAPKTKFMAVVKSNAYGHDMVPFAKELSKIGVDFFGVDSLEEALALRKEGIKEPILVLGFVFPSDFALAAEKNISVTISSLESLEKLSSFAKASQDKLKVHIKVDTGLHRQGFLGADVEKVFKLLAKVNPNPSQDSRRASKIIVEGLYTHFAVMETPKYISYSREQITRLNKWQKAFKASGFKPIVHSSASSGIIFSNEFHFDMARAGISLYGLWPSLEIAEIAPKTKLLPVLSWKSVVSEVKSLPAGHSVGYDLTEKLSRDSILAIVPVGYWHGYPRSLSSGGIVLIRGKRAKVLGRVSMDMIIVDVTDIKGVKQTDEVVLIGKQGSQSISAEEFAEKAGTINYEIVTRINPLILRIYF